MRITVATKKYIFLDYWFFIVFSLAAMGTDYFLMYLNKVCEKVKIVLHCQQILTVLPELCLESIKSVIIKIT